MTRLAAAALALTIAGALSACSTSAPVATAPAPTQASPSASPVAQVAPTPSPAPTAKPKPQPSTVSVRFTGLAAGGYPVHLHSACSGLQAFHITVLGRLAVGAGRSGSIAVPRSYFGRGLCLIVYGNAALTTVLRAQPI